MKGAALLNVSEALRAHIEARTGGDTVYVGPLDDDEATKKPLVLFLYRLAANPDLRNADHHVPPQNPGELAEIYERSLPLDALFLLSVSTAKPAESMDSLETLGRAMQALNDDAVLVGGDVGGETVRLSLETVTTEEMSRIWSLFPSVNYRTSVAYRATPVWIDPDDPPESARPVVSESYDYEALPA
jgi:hypothetical protein